MLLLDRDLHLIMWASNDGKAAILNIICENLGPNQTEAADVYKKFSDFQNEMTHHISYHETGKLPGSELFLTFTIMPAYIFKTFNFNFVVNYSLQKLNSVLGRDLGYECKLNFLAIFDY